MAEETSITDGFISSSDFESASATQSLIKASMFDQLHLMDEPTALKTIRTAARNPRYFSAAIGLPMDPTDQTADSGTLESLLFDAYAASRALHLSGLIASRRDEEARVADAELGQLIFDNARMSDDDIARAQVNSQLGDDRDMMQARDAYFFR